MAGRARGLVQLFPGGRRGSGSRCGAGARCGNLHRRIVLARHRDTRERLDARIHILDLHRVRLDVFNWVFEATLRASAIRRIATVTRMR